MYFITGSKFTVVLTTPQQKTHAVTNITSSVSTNKRIDDFECGKTYTIDYIKFNRDKIPPTFTYNFSSSKTSIFKKEFTTTAIADEYISKLSNIILPDYKNFYQKRND
jgi:hypothetical protein